MSDSLRPHGLCNSLGSSVHGILQARILEWVAFPFFRGSFRLRDRTQVSRIAGRFFTIWATREAQGYRGSWTWQEDREDVETGRQWGGSGGWRQSQEPLGLRAKKVGLEVTEQGRNELRHVSDSLHLSSSMFPTGLKLITGHSGPRGWDTQTVPLRPVCLGCIQW